MINEKNYSEGLINNECENNQNLFWLGLSEKTNLILIGLLSYLKQNSSNFNSFSSFKIKDFISSIQKIQEFYSTNISNEKASTDCIHSDLSKLDFTPLNLLCVLFHSSVIALMEEYFKSEVSTNLLTETFQSFIFDYFEFVKNLIINSEANKNLYYHSLKERLYCLLDSIMKKHLEYTNAEGDTKNILNCVRILCNVIEICSTMDEMNIDEFFSFVINSSQIVFNLTKQTFIDELNTTVLNIFNQLIQKEFTTLKFKISNIQMSNLIKKLSLKIIEIAAKKENLKEILDYVSQTFYVSNLILLLKCLLKIVPCFDFQVDKEEETEFYFVKSIVYLSFWENCTVMDHTCQVIHEYWKKTVSNHNREKSILLKTDFAMIFDYFFIKKIKEIYIFLKDNINEINDDEEHHQIEILNKVASLELILSYLNIFLNEKDFLYVFFVNFDLVKLEGEVFNEIFTGIIKFFEFNGENFIFLKNSIISSVNKILTLINSWEEIIEKDDLVSNEKTMNFNKDFEFFLFLNRNIDFWIKVLELINKGKFKHLFKFFQENFGLVNTTIQDKKKKNAKKVLEISQPTGVNSSTDEGDVNVSSNNSNPNLNESFSSVNSSDGGINAVISVSSCSSFIPDINNPEVRKQEMEKNKKYARLLAIIIRYSKLVDINIVFETIGMSEDFSKQILYEFIETFCFTGLDILSAYRLFISTFKLGGESYILYNIIIEFSRKFYEDNKHIENFPFKSEDQVSTFAYSILMLNTDLHDPGIKEHMTEDGFIKNNQVTGMFNDFDIGVFRNTYKSILSNPLKIAESRDNSYLINDEVFLNYKNKKNYFLKLNNETNENNLCNYIEIIDFPIFFARDFLYIQSSLENKKIKNLISQIFFERFLNSFLTIDKNFFLNHSFKSTKTIVNNIIKLCFKFKKHENYLEKIFSILNNLIISEKKLMEKSSNFNESKINLYNLYFFVTMNNSEKIGKYIESFFSNLTDFIRINLNSNLSNRINAKISPEKIKEVDKHDFSYDYIFILEKVVLNSYVILFKKKMIKKEGYFGFIFGSAAPSESDYLRGMEQFRVLIYKSLLVDSYSKQGSFPIFSILNDFTSIKYLYLDAINANNSSNMKQNYNSNDSFGFNHSTYTYSEKEVSKSARKVDSNKKHQLISTLEKNLSLFEEITKQQKQSNKFN